MSWEVIGGEVLGRSADRIVFRSFGATITVRFVHSRNERLSGIRRRLAHLERKRRRHRSGK